MNTPIASNNHKNGLEIAIIGISGRFPKAKNVDEFWQNLKYGLESISFFADEELVASGIDSAVLKHPNYVRAKATLEDIELFDALFFGFSPREAEIVEPQQRLFLECAWEALESAGYDSETYQGSIGVYAGTSLNSYFLNLYSNRNLIDSVDNFQLATGNDKDFLSTRVSYKLNLEGPSYTVQTACSTSLVAVHLASQSLLSGECDMALAGGVAIRLPQKVGYLYQEGAILSPDGHCRAFDAKAQGTVSGNGVGIVVLKRLEDALADGDCIHAVIKGSAINNDGAFKVSYTAPRIDSQAKVIKMAQVVAEVEPESITYIETHGTGTPLGDPIEIAALTQAFRTSTHKKSFCAIGSVKTNIGHLDAAAGVAGLIKTALTLKHKQIPPSLHFEQPNPQIDFANSPFFVNTQLSEWQANGTPRRAGVSSFGIGGTNAHVILEEAPVVEASGSSRHWQLLVLSTKTSSALETATANLVKHFKQYPDLKLADVAYTLQVGRRAFDHRRIVVCQNLEDAVQVLETKDLQRVFTHFQEPCNRQVVFMFPGQGTQYVEMGLELYQTEPIFREQVDRCCELLKSLLGLDLRTILYPSEEKAEAAAQQLQQTDITQSALFVVEYALAQLWMAWGVHPHAMIGHSIGEYVAACLAGVFSLEDALALVAARGQLMQQLPTGAMLSVPLSEQEVQPLLGQELSLAGINGPAQCVVSGRTEAVEELQSGLTEQGIDCRRLHTSHAFHSPMMAPIIEPFAELLQNVNLKSPKIPFVSNVTGSWITVAEVTNPNYWAKHLRQTVRFAEGISELLKEPRVLLEVGPGRTLSTFTRRHQVDRQVVLSSLRHPNDKHSDAAFLLNTLGRLWLAGVQVNWSGYYAQERRHRLPLPTYPFERQRYWIEGQNSTTTRQELLHKKTDIADWFYIPVWKQSMALDLFADRDVKQKSCWLVFIDGGGVSSQIAKRLEQQGQTVISVRVGEQFAKLSDRAYAINPQQRDDYNSLLQALSAQGKLPNAIAHLWSLTPNEQAKTPNQLFEECQNLGFYSLLFLAQAIGKQQITDPLDLLVVTSEIHDVTGDEKLSPEKATVLGSCKVIPQEYPNINCRSIDVVVSSSGTWQEEKLVDQLLKEFTTKSSDLSIAYYGNYRWVQSFEAVRLQKAIAEKTRLREGGVYLIAGGLGGIGLAIAEYLAQTVRAKLVLIGRSALPEREEWEKWLATHDEFDSVSSKIRKVQALENLGAEILVCRADVAYEEQMRAAITKTSEHFGEINGVIHAAGIGGGGLIQFQTPEKVASVLASKVKGTQVLDTLFKDVKLDFLVLCSSIRSLIGGPGRVEYCAANAFLDAFAHRNTSRNGTFTVSINWGAWREVGMSLGASPDILEKAMFSKEGVDAFSRILCSNLPQVVVSPEDFHARIEQENTAHTASSVLEKLEKAPLSRQNHPRPQLSNSYVAPRNKVEQTIADIWQQLLGIQQVGIQDNFFELGGDSVISIQFIARANQASIQLSTNQVFEHQTIAELAAVADTAQIVQAEQGLVTGPVPLTPIQHWFFQQNQPDPHHWNMTVVLEILQVLDPVILEQGVRQLLVHHDALRLRFLRSESSWKQVNASEQETIPFIRLDFSALSPDEQERAMEATAAELQVSLNLPEGPIVRVALFDLGVHQPSRMLVVIHHLAVDFGSWRILFEDLQTAYQQMSRGEAIHLPQKTTSFKQWSERLREYARSAELQLKLDYWLSEPRKQVSHLPVDYPRGTNTVTSANSVSVGLSLEETQALLQEVPAVYRTQTEEVLLTALVQAFAEWTGVNSLLVDLEGSGREVTFEGVDLSRTVGWFTTIYPILLDLGKPANPGEALTAVKEQLRTLPNGIDYGVLRYLSKDAAIVEKMQAIPKAEVSFLYTGQLAQTLPKSSLFGLTQEFNGPTRSVRGSRSHLLEVKGFVAEGQLQMTWTYSEAVHRQTAVQILAQNFVAALRSLITHCQSIKAEGYTPFGFPDTERIETAIRTGKGLQAPPLERVSRDGNLPLSFAQQRLWFLNQLEPDKISYNEPFAMRLTGSLNAAVLEQSFNEIIRRHEALRTTFATTGDGQPIQVIAPVLTLTLPVVDLQDLPEHDREAQAMRLVAEEAQQPFDLEKGPLLRVSLMQLNKSEYIVLLTKHHIVSDGWSKGVLVRELAALYEAFCAGKPSPLPELPIQYVDFAIWQRNWLQGKVLEAQLSYWKQQLGSSLPVLKLPTVRPRSAVQTFRGATYSFVLPTSLSKSLQKLSNQEGVTLFMTLLTSLMTLLHRYTHQDDIVVGTDVANRNRAETEGLIGFFINILVLRTDLSGHPRFRELLRRVRDVALGAYAHQDLPFAKLVDALQPERNSSHTPLFQVLFVLQNTPKSVLKLPGLTLTPLAVDNGTARFDLTLFLKETEQGLAGTWRYNADLFDATTITRMCDHFETLLGSIMAQPDARIDALEMLTEAEKKEQIQAEEKQEKSNFKKFKNFKPKAVKLPQGQLIETDYLRPGETLPLVVKPNANELDLVDWVRSNREFIETKLLKHGAILFRNFNISSVTAFENLAQAICPELFGEYGDLPREGISDKVYGSTPYPSDQAILFHNESSHLHQWPLKIWFFCVQPAQQGGETPIVDCRKVYQLLDPKLREKFASKQLMYVRNYTEGLDVSWQEFFHTTDKATVERYCHQAGIDFEWLSGNGLVTRKVRPAVSKHPKTGELVFFNQVQLHHISCLEPAVRASLLSMFGEERLPRNVYYGDGSPIEDSVVEKIRAVYQEATSSFPWQKGDVLMLDNMLTAHGRNPYQGSRKIVVAMGEMIASEDISKI